MHKNDRLNTFKTTNYLTINNLKLYFIMEKNEEKMGIFCFSKRKRKFFFL